MKIIKASKANFKAIVALENERFEDNYSDKTIERDLNNPNNTLWVALDGDNVLGYLNVFHIFDEANLQRIAVFKESEGKGIASKLLKHAEGYLKKKGITKIYLEVSEKNSRAIEFYKKNEYKETNRRKNYYSDLSDAIIMWKFF